MHPFLYYIYHPNIVASKLLVTFFQWLPDKIYLKYRFRLAMAQKLNLNNPLTYNEKLQWLKLYNRRPEYTMMVDKIKVKEYVASVIGSEYIIPTLGTWENPNDIDFNKLPNRFVLKCNHNSGLGMFICKDKNKIDVENIKKKLRKGLKENYFKRNREWPYKNVPRRILAEQYVDPEPGKDDLPDYKFFCFNGKVKALFIATNRTKGEHAVRFDFYDEHFNHLPFTNGHPNADILPGKPVSFEKMKQLAEKLSKNIPHVRIDLYDVNGKILFGEMTFFHWSGMIPFEPQEWDYKFGSWIQLPLNR